jgi:hypothetical protein
LNCFFLQVFFYFFYFFYFFKEVTAWVGSAQDRKESRRDP